MLKRVNEPNFTFNLSNSCIMDNQEKSVNWYVPYIFLSFFLYSAAALCCCIGLFIVTSALSSVVKIYCQYSMPLRNMCCLHWHGSVLSFSKKICMSTMSVSSTNSVFILMNLQYLISADPLSRYRPKKSLLQTYSKIFHVCQPHSYCCRVASVFYLCDNLYVLFRPGNKSQYQCYFCM